MKQIGAEIGVNESRVSQLHARAIRRLKDALTAAMPAAEAAQAMRTAILSFQQKPRMAKATLSQASTPGVVVPYSKVSRTARSKARQRQAVPSRKTARMARMTHRASESVATAVAPRFGKGDLHHSL